MSTRPMFSLIYAVQTLRQMGEDTGPVLQRFGLDQDKLDPNAQIERTLELKINIELAKQLRNPLAGLEAGSFLGVATFGPLGMLTMTCANTQQSIEMGLYYHQLTYLYSTLRIDTGKKLIALELMPLTPKAFRFRMDLEMAGTHRMFDDIGMATSGNHFRPTRVDMPYPRPAEAKAYEDHFRCPVHFNQSQGRLWFHPKAFHATFRTHDATMYAHYRGLCDQQLLRQHKTLDSLTERVRTYLDLFQNTLPQAARVAEFFGLSERTFRLKLNEEDSNFRTLVGDTRYRRAQHLLHNTTLSIEDIAEQLGYAEAAAFTHAFQRWSGTTPLTFRTAQ